MRTSSVPVVCRGLAGGRIVAIAVAAGMVTAMVGASAASASVAAHRPLRPAAHQAEGSGLTLRQAPQGLRTAVRKTVGRPARPAITTIKRTKLADPGTGTSDYFGWSVAMSGSYAAIGAPGTNDYDGVVYVFVRNATTGAWSKQAELTDPGGVSGDAFGWSVAISGSYLVVGASDDGSEDTGNAYVYVRSGTKWTLQATLPDPFNQDGSFFGGSVAISGSTVVIGAPGTNSTVVGTYSGPGEAWVFTRSGSTWTQQAALADPGGGANDDFGGSVAITGSTLVIGAAGTNSYSGAVYVFTGSGSTWTQQDELTDPGTGEDAFGSSVAISGSYLVAGAVYAPGIPSDVGAAYVFTGSGSTWSKQATWTDPVGATDDEFGTSVAISGSTAVVGARAPASGKGAAYVFTRSGTTWSKHAKLTDGTGASGDNFGGSVAIYKSRAMVGAENGASFDGVTYAFTGV